MITIKINISQRFIDLPLSAIMGNLSARRGPYPKNHRAIRTTQIESLISS